MSLLLTSLLSSLCVAQPAALRAYLEGRTAEVPQEVTTFYEQRDFEPVWLPDPQRAEALLAMLRRAGQEGLDPAHYPADRLEAMVRATRGRAAGDVRNLDAEVALTEAFFRFAADLSTGRVPPSQMHRGWVDVAPVADVGALLAQALTRGSMEGVVRRLRPPYAGYAALVEALDRYRRLRQSGGWPVLTPAGVLKRGDQSEAVARLRARIALTHGPAGEGDVFDESLEQAVVAFQGRMGLQPDGIVGPRTFDALNVPVEDRIRQIEWSLERWRWLPHDPAPRYVLINAAGGRLTAFERDTPILAMKAIVGALSTPTPLFHTRMEGVILAPYWNVPTSIAQNEILPRVARDPGYLARNDMRRVAGGQIRQDPGPNNPLGRLKFVVPNPYSIGLHDTNAPHLFERVECAFSHGCIRLEKPIELALFALKGDTTWTRDRLEATIERWREQHVALPAPIPVYVSYWPVWVDEEGRTHFRRDLYGYDERHSRALRSRR